MRIVLVILLVGASVCVNAQTNTTSVVIKKDPRIDLLIKKQMQINEASTRITRSSAPGFRIQVANTSDRTKALEIKTKVYKMYPELKAYLLYQAPYFRLRVGNFKTREEANAYMKKLATQFESLLIVRDIIEVKPEAIKDSTSFN